MSTVLGAEWERLGLADLAGRTVLDVEAADGSFSFEAERRGAARVVAQEPAPPPGFEAARAELDSRVEPLAREFSALEASTLGRFDVVLFVDVLCGLPDPLAGLRRLAALTRELAVVATPAVVVPGAELEPLVRFSRDGAFPVGASAWWLPTEHGLHHLCRAAGFKRVETVEQSEAEFGFGVRPIGLRRLVVWASPA